MSILNDQRNRINTDRPHIARLASGHRRCPRLVGHCGMALQNAQPPNQRRRRQRLRRSDTLPHTMDRATVVVPRIPGCSASHRNDGGAYDCPQSYEFILFSVKITYVFSRCRTAVGRPVESEMRSSILFANFVGPRYPHRARPSRGTTRNRRTAQGWADDRHLRQSGNGSTSVAH